MDRRECALCHRQHSVFYCARCTSGRLQQSRTMLAALQADVAVLRKKSEAALNSKSAIVNAEQRLEECMKKVELLTDKVMNTREQLCSERIALVENSAAFERHSMLVENGHQRLERDEKTVKELHDPMLQSLDLQVAWTNDNAAKVRGEKMREVFALFGVVPPSPEDQAFESSVPQNAHNHRHSPFFRTIAQLPLPVSGRYEVMPPEVAAGALGKLVHLLTLLAKYLQFTYPHPMEFNGSFSTIGNTNEGASCHTLYPDGSVGFDRGVAMLHENVTALCDAQGVSMKALHRTDLLGNLLLVYQSPSLGALTDDAAPSRLTSPQLSGHNQTVHSHLGQSAFFLANSQTLDASAEILPDYSMVQS